MPRGAGDQIGYALQSVRIGLWSVIEHLPADDGMLVADGPDAKMARRAHQITLPRVILPGPGDDAGARHSQPAPLAGLLPRNHAGLTATALQRGRPPNEPAVGAVDQLS